MKGRNRTVKILIGLLVAALPLEAFAWTVQLKGQYRPRLEINDKTLNASAPGDAVVTHRARIGVGLGDEAWSMYVAPQHVFGWGTEAGSLAKTSGDLDMHEAWAEGRKGGASIRVGRQELVWDDQRLLGAVNWTQQARVFDAVRVKVADEDIPVLIDAFGALQAEAANRDVWLYGANFAYKMDDWKPVLAMIGEYSRKKATGEEKFQRYTPYLDISGKLSGILLHAMAALQAGGFTKAAVDTSYLGWMATASIGYKADGIGKLAVAADILSGDDDATDNTNSSFHTLFATNHKFYGHMDYFLNVPVHAGGNGLIDAYLTWASPKWKKAGIGLAAHALLTQVDTAASNRYLGTEIDLKVTYAAHKWVGIAGGYSLFAAGDAMVDIGRADQAGRTAHWGWLQMNVAIGNAWQVGEKVAAAE